MKTSDRSGRMLRRSLKPRNDSSSLLAGTTRFRETARGFMATLEQLLKSTAKMGKYVNKTTMSGGLLKSVIYRSVATKSTRSGKSELI